MEMYDSYNEMINNCIDNGDFEWAKRLINLRDEKETTQPIRAIQSLFDKYAVVINNKARNIASTDINDLPNQTVIVFESTPVREGSFIEKYQELTLQEKYYLMGYLHGKKSYMWGNMFYIKFKEE